MSTAPYSPDTPALLPYTLGQDVAVTATFPAASGLLPVPLDVQNGSTLTWDEATAPRCVARIVAHVPEDQATLDALDPRAGVRLGIVAGYVRPDRDDVQPVADLQLRARAVARPENTLSLDAGGAEAAVTDAGGPPAPLTAPGATVTAGIVAILTSALGAAPALAVSTLPATAPALAPVVEPEQDYWEAVEHLVDLVDGDAYDDGLGRWRLEPRPAVAATPAHDLVVGLRGTILTSATVLTRQGWYNAVQLAYRWTTTEPRQTTDSTGAAVTQYVEVAHLVVGSAAVTTGPRSVTAAGRVLYRETRDVPTTQADANAAAAAILRRKLGLGRSLSLSAIAAWWLRPGMTVAVTLPTGPRELHLVASVTFDLYGGRMSLTTRRPDADATITQGA